MMHYTMYIYHIVHPIYYILRNIYYILTNTFTAADYTLHDSKDWHSWKYLNPWFKKLHTSVINFHQLISQNFQIP